MGHEVRATLCMMIQLEENVRVLKYEICVRAYTPRHSCAFS